MPTKKPGVGLPDYGGTPGGGVNRSAVPAPASAPRPQLPGFTTPTGEAISFDPGTAGVGFSPKRLAPIDLDLTIARTRERIEVTGTGLWMIYATDNAALVEVRLRQPDQPGFLKLLPGVSFNGVPFAWLEISHAAQAGVSIQLVVVNDTPEDRLLLES